MTNEIKAEIRDFVISTTGEAFGGLAVELVMGNDGEQLDQLKQMNMKFAKALSILDRQFNKPIPSSRVEILEAYRATDVKRKTNSLSPLDTLMKSLEAFTKRVDGATSSVRDAMLVLDEALGKVGLLPKGSETPAMEMAPAGGLQQLGLSLWIKFCALLKGLFKLKKQISLAHC